MNNLRYNIRINILSNSEKLSLNDPLFLSAMNVLVIACPFIFYYNIIITFACYLGDDDDD